MVAIFIFTPRYYAYLAGNFVNTLSCRPDACFIKWPSPATPVEAEKLTHEENISNSLLKIFNIYDQAF